jgi:hypothetical protein
VKLLVIDDDMLLARALAMVVRHIGWETQIATSLHDGLKALDEGVFDTIVLDLNLGDSLWRATVDRLPEIWEKAKGSRLVLSSGFVPPGVVPGGYCDAMIQKATDVAPDRLIEIITGKPASHEHPERT